MPKPETLKEIVKHISACRDVSKESSRFPLNENQQRQENLLRGREHPGSRLGKPLLDIRERFLFCGGDMFQELNDLSQIVSETFIEEIIHLKPMDISAVGEKDGIV